jgi:hypothetical protein
MSETEGGDRMITCPACGQVNEASAVDCAECLRSLQRVPVSSQVADKAEGKPEESLRPTVQEQPRNGWSKLVAIFCGAATGLAPGLLIIALMVWEATSPKASGGSQMGILVLGLPIILAVCGVGGGVFGAQFGAVGSRVGRRKWGRRGETVGAAVGGLAGGLVFLAGLVLWFLSV